MANQILHYPETFGYRTYPAKNEITTVVDANSTNNQIPTAKAVYEFDKHNKGYFANYDKLIEAYPTAEIGDYATLGSTGTIWFWDNTAWVDSDKKGEVSSVGGLTGAVGIVGDTCITVTQDNVNNQLSIAANRLTAIVPNADDTTLPTSKAVVDYSIAQSNIETNTSESGSDTKVASTNYVINYIASLGFEQAVTSTVNKTVAPLTAQTYMAIDGALGKACDIVVTPNINNIGAVYISESNTYSGINPIYPDPTNNYYKFANAQNVYIFVDNVGDSVDLTISYRG